MQNLTSFPTLPVCCCSPGSTCTPIGRHLAPAHPSSPPASIPFSGSQEAYHRQGSTSLRSAITRYHLLSCNPDPHTPCLLMPAGVYSCWSHAHESKDSMPPRATGHPTPLPSCHALPSPTLPCSSLRRTSRPCGRWSSQCDGR